MSRSHSTMRRGRLALLRGMISAIGIAASTAASPMDTAPSSDLPDLSAVRAEIYSGEYEKAAAELLALAQTVHHADVYNLLGFSLRNLKRYDEAARWYKEAIFYDPLTVRRSNIRASCSSISAISCVPRRISNCCACYVIRTDASSMTG